MEEWFILHQTEMAKIAKLAMGVADDAKAKDIVLLDMQGVTLVADYFLICSGTSSVHVKSIADAINVAMKSSGLGDARLEGYDSGIWVLLDFGGLVVHVFQEDARLYYDLERLWRDAREVVD